MSDQPILIPIQATIEGSGGVISELQNMKKVVGDLAEMDVSGKLKTQVQVVQTSLESLTQSLVSNVGAQAKAMADAAAAGAEGAVGAVKRARLEMQAEYERMVAAGKSLDLGELKRMREGGVQLFPADSSRYADAQAQTKMETESTRAAEALRKRARAEESQQWDAYFQAQEKQAQGFHADMLRDEVAYQDLMQRIKQGQALDAIKDAEILGKYLQRQQEGLDADQLRDEVAYQNMMRKVREGQQLDAIKDAELMGRRMQKMQEGLHADSLRDEVEYQRRMQALQQEAIRNRDLNAQFAAMSPQGQLTRATRIASIATDEQGAAFARAKYGSDAVDAAAPQALATLTAEVERLNQAKQSLNRTTAAGVKPAQDLQKAHIDVTGGMRDMHSAARGLASGFNAMWLTWGNILPLMAGAAVSNAAMQALRMGSEVGQALTTIQVLGGASTEEVNKLNTALLDTARSGPFGPGEVAKALKTLALAGLNATEQMQALKPVLDFSVAGDMGIDKAAESLVAVSTAFGYQSKDLSVAGDIIAKTAAISMASTEGMAASFKVASVVAEQYQVSLKDVATSLALLSQIGIKDQAAGTAVRNMYTELMGSSQKARQVMKEVLKFDVFDGAGKMKELPVIFEGLAESLVKLDKKSQLAALSMLGNERGTKAISANLSAVASDFEKSGDSAERYANRLKEVQSKLDDAPGFAAISAIGMAGTTMNQMKQTASTLQAALVEAFQAAEPAILRVAVALRDVFNSDRFKSSVEGLVSSVAGLTRLLVEHADTILNVGKAYVVYKVASLAATGASVALTAVQAALATNFARSIILAAEMNIALGSTTVGAYASATAMGALNAVMRLNPIVAVASAIMAAGTAFYLFADSQNEAGKAAKKTAEDNAVATRITVEGLDKELERLDNLLKAKGDKAKAEELDAQSVRDKAIEAVEANGALAVSSLEAARARQAQALADTNWLYNLGLMSEAAKKENDQRLREMDKQILRARENNSLEVEMLKDKFELVKKKSKEARDLAEAGRRPGLPTGSNTFDPDSLRNGSSAKAFDAQSNNALANIKKQYDTEMSVVTEQESAKQKMLTEFKNGNLIKSGQFYAQELALAEETEDRKAEVTKRARAAYSVQLETDIQSIESALEKWKKTPDIKSKKLPTAEEIKAGTEKAGHAIAQLQQNAASVFAQFDASDQKAEDTKLARMQLQAIKLAAELHKVADESKAFDRAEADGAAKRARTAATDKKLLYADPREAAVIAATANEFERINDTVVAQGHIIDDLNESLTSNQDILDTQSELSEKERSAIESVNASLRAQIALRTKRKEALQATADSSAKKAGDAAGTKFDDQIKAESDWKNGAVKSLKEYEREANNVSKNVGAAFAKSFKGMEDNLLKFVKTGQLNFGDLADSIIDDLIRIAIQKSITGPLATAMLGMFADGGAFGAGGIQAFANGGAFTNQIVNSPTLFKFANGTGMMGEAGPEAIMPLTRGPGGKLGVQATGAGGGNSMVVNIIESSEKGGKVERRTEGGVDVLDVFVEKVKAAIANDINRGSGAVPGALNRTYGLNRAAGAY